MAYEVEMTASAEKDLEEIVAHIAVKLSNPKAAANLLAEFWSKKSLLADAPTMFPLCTDERLQSEGFRRFLIKEEFCCAFSD